MSQIAYSALEELPLIEDSLDDPLGGQDIMYGLPEKEVVRVCKRMYKNDVVKVTLQIGEPEAMQLKMDVAVTFADALGIVGEALSNINCTWGNTQNMYTPKIWIVHKIELKFSAYNQLILKIRETPTELIKFTGGTIGLFLGMSIVSVIEALYWIYRVWKVSRLEPIRNFALFLELQAIKRMVKNDASDWLDYK